MPLVDVDLWEGRTVEQKKKLVAGITDLFVEITACPREAVTVIIRDVPKHNWGSGGELSSEKFKDK
ncbi:MAG: 4-oxalocrotonate tautomerase [Elusimicrobiota bacterium]|nr:4-oxalocrotonate tautomerase [Elusimicrobiota bacterium]